MPQPANPEANAVIVITKAGVVSVRCRYEEDIRVNQDDLLSLLEEELEKKRREGGKLSGDQKEWFDGLHTNGYCVCRCDGWEQAVAVLEGYLRGKARKE